MNIRNIFSSFKMPSLVRALFYLGGFAAVVQHVKAVVYLTNYSEQASDVLLCGQGTGQPYICTDVPLNQSNSLQQVIQCRNDLDPNTYTCYGKADVTNVPTQLTLGTITCDVESNCNCTDMGNGIQLTQDTRWPNSNLFYATDKGGSSYGQVCPPFIPKDKDEYIKEDDEESIVQSPSLRL